MGRAIIKASQDDGTYILWSTVVDGPLMWGTRKEFVKHAKKRREPQLQYPIEPYLDRADETSCSDRIFPHNWEEDETYNWFGLGYIRRSQLMDACNILYKSKEDDPRILAMLEKFDFGEDTE
jgi:hypothetical protein